MDFLTKCPIEKGGYAGGDVAELAKILPVSPQALRKRINYWITNDPAFKQLRYLGKQLQWLILFGINVVDTYNLPNARASLSTVFTYTDLKTLGGIDIDSIASRLQEAKKWFQQTYPGVNPFEWFPGIRSRSKVIRNHCLKDILIDELIHRMGWIQRSKDGNRQKIENRIRTQWIDKYYDVGDILSARKNNIFLKHSNEIT